MSKVCKSCGIRVEEGEEFCPSCGAKISDETSPAGNDSVSMLFKVLGKLFLAFIAGFIFLAVVGSFANSPSKDTASKNNEVVSSEPVEPKAEPLTEADFVIDGLTLGMSKADVEKKLGAGKATKFVDVYNYGDYSMLFTANGKASIIGFLKDGIYTARKVSVGSTLAALERIYGTNYRRDDEEEKSFNAVYALGNLELRFSVSKESSKVTSKVMAIALRDTKTFVPPKPQIAALTDSDFVIGDLSFGMTPDHVERKLGKPNYIGADDWYEYSNIGVHFRNGVSSDVIGVGIKNIGTPRKIFVGSTFAEIEKAYGTNYRRDDSTDKTFTIGYTLGEKILAFILDKDSNRVTTILAAEDINTINPPADKPKPQPKPQQPREQPKPRVDNRDAAERILKEFTMAYMNHDRAGMESCSFYEERYFSREQGYELLDTQMNVWDLANQVHTQTFGTSWQYTFEILSMSKVNADTYEAEVVLILGPDTLSYPNIRVCNVGGRWLVDADSFVYSASMSAGKVFLGY